MNIINIGYAVLNNYILETPAGYLVIDTGYAGGFDKFLRRLKAKSIALNDIKYIFLTHAHGDHAGFLGQLLEATGATAIMHRHAPDRLLSGQNFPGGGCPGALARLFVSAMDLTGKGGREFPAIDVRGTAAIWDGEPQFLRDLGIPLEIIPLPGHTADSIGLLSDDGELFCGDAAMNGFPSRRRNIVWIENLSDYINSRDSMISRKAITIYPSHGKPFPADDLTRFRSCEEDIALR